MTQFFMMWYDNTKGRSLSDKIKHAVHYYEMKYGTPPTLCIINPKALEEAGKPDTEVSILPLRNVIINHLWIGIEEGEKE